MIKRKQWLILAGPLMDSMTQKIVERQPKSSQFFNHKFFRIAGGVYDVFLMKENPLKMS